MNREEIRIILGIVGNVVSFFLFVSPVPTFIKIYKAKSVQEFKPDPYIATILNCALWVFYGIPVVHPDSVLVVTINGVGLFIEAAYIFIFFLYSGNWAKRRKIIIALICEAIFFGLIVFITLAFLHGTKKRSMFVGIVCIVFNIVMYTSPLTVMKRVIQTKSVKYMPFSLSLANFMNAGLWTAYSLMKFDPYILVPNCLGTISGMVQLGLYASFYKTTNWEEDETKTCASSEVELSGAARA